MARVSDEIILRVENLRTQFRTERGLVKAVDGISFTLHRGETLGIVGESGSGKSVTNLSVLQLIDDPPGRITGGRCSSAAAISWRLPRSRCGSCAAETSP